VPGARIEVLAGVGHFAQIEAADEVNRLIADFTESPA
jgi:pimeloyl-ACP methyl ester carboxylesterase